MLNEWSCSLGANLEVPLLSSFLQEEQGRVGHAKGEYDLVCMYMISCLQIPNTLAIEVDREPESSIYLSMHLYNVKKYSRFTGAENDPVCSTELDTSETFPSLSTSSTACALRHCNTCNTPVRLGIQLTCAMATLNIRTVTRQPGLMYRQFVFWHWPHHERGVPNRGSLTGRLASARWVILN